MGLPLWLPKGAALRERLINFLQKAQMQGATIKNGLEMLHIQAEKAWAIWNN